MSVLIQTLILATSALLATPLGANPAEPGLTSPPATPITLKIKGIVATKYPTLVVEATFTNTSKKPIVLYRPQDGSFYGWVAPHFDFMILPKGSKTRLGPGGRCGNHGARYGAAARITLEPGKSTTLTLHPPHAIKGASYNVRLTYSVAPNRYPLGGRLYVPSAKKIVWTAWPKGTWVGTVSSNTITVTVP